MWAYLGVELVRYTSQGLIVNEIAPQGSTTPGHWTQNGCAIGPVRAAHSRRLPAGRLGDGQRFADVVMENLIGDDMNRVPDLAKQADTALHLYGKADVKPGRKMGHINWVIRLNA